MSGSETDEISAEYTDNVLETSLPIENTTTHSNGIPSLSLGFGLLSSPSGRRLPITVVDTEPSGTAVVGNSLFPAATAGPSNLVLGNSKPILRFSNRIGSIVEP